MTTAEGISKLGFRRWYERQLIEGHVYLVTCVLAMMAVAACLELVDWHGPLTHTVFMVSVMAGGIVVALKALKRYGFLLQRAEVLGEQSSCAHCKTYGILKVLDASVGEERRVGGMRDTDNTWIRVRCKKCGNEWRMNNG